MSNQREERNEEFWDPDFYETGSTRPPKNNGGLVAVLLVAVILLGGLASALGIINLKLLQELAESQEHRETVSLFDDPVTHATETTGKIQEQPECTMVVCLGLRGQTVSAFDQRFYDLPSGVLVLEVLEGGAAAAAGVRNGDVITALDGRQILDQEELLGALATHSTVEPVKLTVYRQPTEAYLELELVLEE